MKQIISIILISLCLTAITAQINLVSNWTTGWQTQPYSCCIPSEIISTEISPSQYQLAFIFSYDYDYPSTNPFCISSNITGNFVTEISYLSNQSFPNYNETTFGNADTGIYGLVTSSWQNSFISIYLSSQCSFYLIPSNASSGSEENLESEITGTYNSFTGIMGFNLTTNNLVNSCCIPSSVSLEFFFDGYYINRTASYSLEDLNNPWCKLIANNASNIHVYNDVTGMVEVMGIYEITYYNEFITGWSSTDDPIMFQMENNNPEIITNVLNVNNTYCVYNMSLSSTDSF